jgi:hypothetical protein
MNVFRMLGFGTGTVAVAFALSQNLACSSSTSGPSGNDAGGSSSGASSSGASSSGASSSGGTGDDAGGGSSSGSSSGGSSSGATDQDGGGSSSGGVGSCDAGVYSFDMASANSCIASYAPRMPSTFTAGHCPSGTDGCCFKQGPCGFTSNCNYGLGALVSQAMGQCTNSGGTWQTMAP